jgi:hypothetical protein
VVLLILPAGFVNEEAAAIGASTPAAIAAALAAVAAAASSPSARRSLAHSAAPSTGGPRKEGVALPPPWNYSVLAYLSPVG